MDWFTILLILIFFVFPVIQQILEGKKGRRAPTDDAGDAEAEEWGLPEAYEPTRVETPARQPAEVVTEWSEGWGKWPGAEQKKPEVPTKKVPTEIAGTPTKVYAGRFSPAIAPVPAGHVHRPDAGQPAQVEIRSLHRTGRGGRSRSGSPEWHRHLAILRGAQDPRKLRGVIVMTEVLGTPKGLRI